MKYKAVIFDLDGTLLDTLDDLADSTNMTMSHFGYPARSRDEIRQFVGNGVGVLIEKALPEKVSEEKFAEIVSYQHEIYTLHNLDRTVPYEGIENLLKKLAGEGVKTAVVSNKAQRDVAELSHHFFGELISVSIGETPEIKRKPAPDTLLAAVKSLDVSLDDCVYVGDSETDVMTAENACMDCICVDWGFRSRETLKEAGAELIASYPKELWYLLQEHQSLYNSLAEYINESMASDHFEVMYNRDMDFEVHESVLPKFMGEVTGIGRKLEDAVSELQDSFSTALLKLIDRKEYSDVEVYKRAGIDRRLFSKIRSSEDYQPSRSTALALCLGLKLTLEETADLLHKAGYALSDSSVRDVIIRYFIENGEYDLMKVNEALYHFGEECL
ncbi:MAG: HAD family hydrolase [Erysipelotrichaceae bacterium]|nr:HAD family hydrolase [Erysipelotrichaceae bacterium]